MGSGNLEVKRRPSLSSEDCGWTPFDVGKSKGSYPVMMVKIKNEEREVAECTVALRRLAWDLFLFVPSKLLRIAFLHPLIDAQFPHFNTLTRDGPSRTG